ncbi:hypothetical protein EIP91_008928 [Steccherinum ochraceum]|uniref:Inner centromere protein ARK-binding domain-containing protein n=1 Tax=Steccherinum ochraceum TaxID=92696 RepID=A0A4V2MXV0_9APHY|nr:hypothetical protein EIP91_008928 [Steccherinum ochraceum]
MDGSGPGEVGVLAWCNTIRFTMVQDPGRAFLDQQVQQQGFDFLEGYLSNVLSRPKEESVYELLKTPGRKKAAQKRTRPNIATTTKVDPAAIISLEDQDSHTGKENVAPVNSFHKALLEAKEKAEDVVRELDETQDYQPEVPASDHTEPHHTLSKNSPVTAMHVDEPTSPEFEDDTPPVIPAIHEEDEHMEARPAMHLSPAEAQTNSVKELSIIAEDDEERSRISSRPPALDDDAPMDLTVPLRDLEHPSAPTLARKPSMTHLAGLSAPSPLRKSMKLHREPSSSTLYQAPTTTPGAALGGKRTSWLVKAKEAKALEIAGAASRKVEVVTEVGFGLGITGATKKRKSGDMLGQVDSPSEDDTERKQKSAKVVEATRHSAPKSFEIEQKVSKPLPLPSKNTMSFTDDFTVPLADISEDEGALDKLKRTVEGFGARTKSMGKSLGGNAAAALAEARAAAQARVAERNMEQGTEVIVESPVTETSTSPATPLIVEEPPAISSERRLSVSDLVPSSGSKSKSKAPTRESNIAADTSVSTTPPDSPRLSTRLSQAPAPAPPPVFSKPPPVFVAPPPNSRPSSSNVKEFAFKLPPSHPFSLPPAMALGVNSAFPSSGSKPVLSAQSSKASLFSDGIFDKEDDVPAWMPHTQDTESSFNPTMTNTQEKEDDIFDAEDSWRVDDKFAAGSGWTPFEFGPTDKDDTMTWTTAQSRSTSQKGGDTDHFTTAPDATDALHHAHDSGERNPFDLRVEATAEEMDMAEMSMDIDDDSPAVVDSELEEIALAGKSTISLVQPQEGARSQSQQSMASTSSSQSQQLGFFGQATKLMTSVLGGGKKTKPEPVKSIQRAAVVAKKQQEEAEKKVTRLRDMEQRRQQALQRKAEEEKLRVQEEEKKLKEEMEKRKREREDLTDKRPLRTTTKKTTEEDTTKKRKLTVEPEKKAEPAKKPPSRDQPSRLGKAATVPVTKIGPPLKSAMKQATPAGHTSLATATSSKDLSVKVVKPTPSSSNLKSAASSLKGKGKAENADDVDQPAQVIQSQMANRVKAQIQAAREPPKVASESIELPEINSEYSDSEDEDRPRKFDPPEWAQSPELRQALQQQSTVDPDDIFGRVGPLRMEEIFRTRTSRFRARTSSANWSGADQLTAEEERAYARRMGYR